MWRIRIVIDIIIVNSIIVCFINFVIINNLKNIKYNFIDIYEFYIYIYLYIL